MMAVDNDCSLSKENKIRLDGLEKNMSFINKALFWLVTTSFATLASLIVGLVITLSRK